MLVIYAYYIYVCACYYLQSFTFAGKSDQFDKYSWRTIDDLGKNYDFKSIMHYDRLAFTKNGKPTIVAIHDPNMKFKTPDGLLSPLDIVEINALYNCRSKYMLPQNIIHIL